MEDKQVPIEGTGNDREVDREYRADQNSRPLRRQHVGADSPFSSISRNPNLRQEAERGDENTRPRLQDFVFHDFYEDTRELSQTSVFYPDNLQTGFCIRTRESCHKVLIS
jgi:hypothetical protein